MSLREWERAMQILRKPSLAARKKAEKRRRLDRQNHETTEKRKVRRRDNYRCRFPLCGCDRLKLGLEASHGQHKGMGGDPKGTRTRADDMVLLCVHRHQSGSYAVHKGTLRWRYLTPEKANGAIAWDILRPEQRLHARTKWIEVARELRLGMLEVLMPRQADFLEGLAKMEV